MDTGVVDGVRVSINVDELRIWKHFEQQRNAECMRRRFEDDRLVVFDRQFFDEVEKTLLPTTQFRRSNVCQFEESLVLGSIVWMRKHQIGR